jgi:hypothetical protein
MVGKNWIIQLHTLPVLHFNRCLTTKYSDTTAHFNGNFDTDNQIYVSNLSAQRHSERTVFRCYLVKFYPITGREGSRGGVEV